MSVTSTRGLLDPYVGRNMFSLVERALKNLLNAEAQIQLKIFARTVRTWNSKPDFTFEIKDGTELSLEVGTDDKVYYFLNYGTSVRRAMMSKNFVPKTSPGRINAHVGRGGRKYVSKKLNLPGIEERGWTTMIMDLRQPIFERKFKRYIYPYAQKLLFMSVPPPPPNRFWE